MRISGSIRKRLVITIAFAFLTIVISYNLAINKTIGLYYIYKAQLRNEQSPVQLRRENELLKIKIQEFANQGFLNSCQIDTRNEIIKTVTEFCSLCDVEIRELFQPIRAFENNIAIETNIIAIEGDFKDQLKLLYKLETNKIPGKVVSVRFTKNLNTFTKKQELIGEYIFQNIENL